MKNLKLINEESKEISELIKISKSIEALIIRLYNLEISNQINTDDFRKTLDYLKIAIQVEDEKYIKLFSSSKKCEKWLSILQDNYKYNDKYDFKYILDDEKKHICRICNELKNRICFSEKNKKNGIFMSISLKKDSINSYLLVLKDIIKNEEDKKILSQLVKLKYYISFMNRDIERILIENNFDILDVIPSEAKFASEICSLDSSFYKKEKNHHHGTIALIAILKIIEIKNEDLKNASNYYMMMLLICLLKSSLLLLDNYVIVHIYNQYKSLISESTNSDIEIAKSFISDCFEDAKKSKKYFYSKDIEYQKKNIVS